MGSRIALGTSVALSAFLLFTLELLVARHILPRFGGAAAVWLTCLVFFQALLLVGYSWAAWLAKRPARAQRLHLLVLASGVVALGVQAAAWGVPLLAALAAPVNPGTVDVLLHLAIASGLPFLALAATAPLIQVWEARRGQEAPWRLYALSNAGALVALFAYPLLIEPTLGLRRQAAVWAGLFTLDVALLAWATLKRSGGATVTEASTPAAAGALRRWLLLSGAGSFVLAAVTNFQTHDLLPAPLLWALPLAIYLVSFIVTFEHERWYSRLGSVALMAAGLMAITWCMARDEHTLVVRSLAFAAFELGACLLCHGELYAARPPPAQAGSYYLWIGVGGGLGTAVVSGLFPLVATDYWEFPALVVGATVGAILVLPRRTALRAVAAGTLALVALGFLLTWTSRRRGHVFSERDFLGVVRVGREVDSWVLLHGGTVHGRQMLDPKLRGEPTEYYARETGLGQTVQQLRERRRGPLTAAMLGLGVGTSVALFGEGDEVVFYELDPKVIDLAKGKGGWFSYLTDSKANWRIELGDARARLAAAPPSKPIDVLGVDVFSGDAVPMHMLTEEAMALYLQHLAPGGVIALHISNRFLLLDRVALAVAKRMKLAAIAYQNPHINLAQGSRWVLVARTQDELPRIDIASEGYTWSEPFKSVPWTDDLASVLPVIAE
jgi:hypothetical protein